MSGGRLDGRVALVTGGGSGLGRATSLRLARGGAHVVVADVDGEKAEKVVAEVQGAGGRAAPLQLDVSDSAAVDAAIGGLVDQHGAAFDCLVNNAGTDRGASLLDLSDEQWRFVNGVNVDGPLFTSRAFLRRVVDAGERDVPADIVNVISISAITVGTDAAAYNSSKAAVAKLTEILQREAHEYRWPVRVHGLMPSAMNTPMMEQWNLSDEVMMDPDTVASAIEFMVALPADTFVQNLVINSRREPGWPR
ncbi:MAG: SDR family NAD(P)-dependent oxidoreductase [Jatrophihabitans sp.]|uniref:SDR family NAD(P)-dependent oxidoreductase n=1 Tax=Jatrophihabitans sp. TaxID=1932789 RepID=UPI003F7F7BB2